MWVLFKVLLCMYVACIIRILHYVCCVFFPQKTRYQAGMRNSENLTANNTFSKPTRYQVTTPSWEQAEVDSVKT